MKIISKTFARHLIGILLVGIATFTIFPHTIFASSVTPQHTAYVHLEPTPAGDPPPEETNCGFTDSISNASYCLLNPMATSIGWFFLAIGVKILTLGGFFFDASLKYFVASLGQTLSTYKIMDVITTVWTAIRDMVNILIIGLFIFIAISIILGIKEYGDKKLIARVIIISVLINFSLLFTKLVIDASDLTSYKIYQTILASAPTTDSSGQSVTSALLRPIGFKTVYDNSWSVISSQSTSTKEHPNTATLGYRVVFGLIAGILLAIMGFVLLYACYVMFLRFFVLIIVLMTASFAFATYILPGWAKQEYAWKGWKEALLNNAMFAPIFMVFLGITFLVLNGTGGQQTTDLSSIATPGQSIPPTSAIQVLITYVLACGLLVFAVKLSRMFASRTGAANSLAKGLGSFALGAATGGASTFAAKALQNTVGKNHYNKAEEHRNESEKIAGRLSLMKGQENTDAYKAYEKKMQKHSKLATTHAEKAKGSYNFMDTGTGKGLAKLLGKPNLGATSEEKKNGYAGTVERAAKTAYEEKVKPRELSSDTKAKAVTDQKERLDSEREAIRGELVTAQSNVEAIRTEIAKKAGGDMPEKLTQAREEVVRVEKEKSEGTVALKQLDTERRAAEESLKEAEAGSDTSATAKARMRFEQARAAHKTALDEQSARITSAHTNLVNIQKDIDGRADDTGYKDKLTKAQQTVDDLSAFESTYDAKKAAVPSQVEEGVKAMRSHVTDQAAEDASSHMKGWVRGSDDYRRHIRDQLGKIMKKEEKSAQQKKRRENLGFGDDSPSKPGEKK